MNYASYNGYSFSFDPDYTHLTVSLNRVFNSDFSKFFIFLFLLFTKLCVPDFNIFEKVSICFDKGGLFKFLPA
jgi:hypothetical protein